MGIKNGFTKYDLYQILSTKDDLAYHLPPTGLFDDFEDLLKFIEDYEKVILKPVDASEGKGICILEKQEDIFKVTDCRKKKQIKLILSSIEELKNFLKSTENNFDKYIIQKLIKSARIEQSVFDIRVVMKKSSTGEWVCGELEYAAGGNKFLLTNVRGEVYPPSLSIAVEKNYPLKFDFTNAIRQVKKLCARTCAAVNELLEYDHDIEFEIAIDEYSKPWFVEVSLFEYVKKFKALDYKTYTTIKGMPLLYSTTFYK